MPAKKGSKTISISGELHARLKTRVGKGLTQFLERIILEELENKPRNIAGATTDELIKVLFGSPERRSEIAELSKIYQSVGKTFVGFEPVRRPK